MAKQKPESITKARIEHLAKEIETVAANLMTFRTRMGFTILVGPFIVIGSVLIATKGEIVRPTFDLLFFCSAFVAIGTYVGLAKWGSHFDKTMSKKCDVWRLAIIALSQGKEPKKETLQFPLPRTQDAYLSGFGLVLIAFVSIALCVAYVLPMEEQSMQSPIIAEIPVHFVYLSTDEQAIPDIEFDATCLSVPRIGETVIPQAGSKKVVVHNVYHKFIKNEDLDIEKFTQYLTVVLKEFP